MAPIDFNAYTFTPIIEMGEDYTVLDFSAGPKAVRRPNTTYTVGKYNEKRPNMYTADIFEADRCIHMGIDLGGPVDTPLKAFFDGTYYKMGINPDKGDYGGVMVTRHLLGETYLYALWGHLSHASIEGKNEGDAFKQGDTVAFIGNKNENGGWPPHLHLQLSIHAPQTHDMPGVVSPSELQAALIDYPDPRLVLGPLY